jgi:DNA-binding transcriptional LysR family regulator
MDEESLRAFASVCRTGNITRSAIELHRSQSALSRRIAGLEAEVGTRLLERSRLGVRPTPPGATFLAHVDTALSALTDGRRAVAEVTGQDVGPVSVAIVGSLASGWIVDVLRDFRLAHPETSMRLHTANSNEVVDLVRRGDADVGIGYGYPTEPGLSAETLFDEQLQVVCAPDHRHAGGSVRSLAALRDETWFAFAVRLPRVETNARFIAGILAAAGVAAENVQTVDSLTAQHRLIQAGFGLGLLAASNAGTELEAGRLARIAAGRLPTTSVYLTTRPEGLLVHATRTLIELLRRAAPTRR